MSQQVAQLEKCFGQLYCKVENMKCVGRNTEKEEELLDFVYIAWWISCGEDCDISCFLMKNCGQCKPTKNPLPPADPCCNPDVYGYVKKFTINDITVTPTGDPAVFDVTVDAFTLQRIFTGSVVECAILVHDYVADTDPYIVDYLATPVTSFTFQLEKNVDDELSFRVAMANKTNDGLLFFGFIYGTVQIGGGVPVVSLIQVEDLTVTIDCSNTVALSVQTNGGTNTMTYHSVKNPVIESNTYTEPIPVTDDIIAFFNNNSGVPFDTNHFSAWGEFVSTCNGPITFITQAFFCSNDTMKIGYGVYGLDYADTVTVEVSTNGGPWTLLYTAPQPNGTNQEDDSPAWDHTMFPEGGTIRVRIRSANMGVLKVVGFSVGECLTPIFDFNNAVVDCGDTVRLSWDVRYWLAHYIFVPNYSFDVEVFVDWGSGMESVGIFTVAEDNTDKGYTFSVAGRANGTYAFEVRLVSDGTIMNSDTFQIDCPFILLNSANALCDGATANLDFDFDYYLIGPPNSFVLEVFDVTWQILLILGDTGIQSGNFTNTGLYFGLNGIKNIRIRDTITGITSNTLPVNFITCP